MDKQAKGMSELISKSLRTQLSGEEASQLEEHLQQDSQSSQFKQLSKLIQKSIVHGVGQEETQAESQPGLPAETKQRLNESIAAATLEKASLSLAGLITSSGTNSTKQKPDAAELPAQTSRAIGSRFRLIKSIGQGGLGQVWLAVDEQLNRKVAIKELNREGLESPRAWRRFHREAEITGLLEHPNIVPIYLFGNDRTSAEPFYVMRFVGKRTLADAITEYQDRIDENVAEPLDLHRLLSTFLDVCQAIAYAHSRGVIHRDLKPENIALDHFGQVIVLDWGLAKLTDDSELANQLTDTASTSDSSLTHTIDGDIIGTPLYMAPEQAAGDLDRVGYSTDIYGLGAILFAILTGSAPHARSAVSNELPEILKTISEGQTPSPRDYCESVPSDLDNICRQAMHRKQHLRHDSVTTFAEEIERWMAGQTKMKARYESLRIEGRELRSRVDSLIADMERNTNFMSHLPPIQQMIVSESEQELNEWRSRLATIFKGLLQANPDYQSVIYSKIEDSTAVEMVRVERDGRDGLRVRSMPRTRLSSYEMCPAIKRVSEAYPDEVLASIVEMKDPNGESMSRLISGSPIYDEQTEEVFGLVLLQCNIGKFLAQQLGSTHFSDEIVVVSDLAGPICHKRNGMVTELRGLELIRKNWPAFDQIADRLQGELEFIDTSSHLSYGARLWLQAKQDGLQFYVR